MKKMLVALTALLMCGASAAPVALKNAGSMRLTKPPGSPLNGAGMRTGAVRAWG